MLGSLGIAGDVERDFTVVEDVDDLLEEVVDDLYVRRFHWGDRPRFKRAEALQIARAAVENPTADIEPASAPADSTPAMRARLAGAVRDELELRKRRAGLLTYDDLLTRLDEALGRRRRRARSCAPATGWCSSTSSRTPTRCSGTSCAARSARAAARWC